MTILIVGGVLLGAVLGRFFRVWILVPTGVVAIVAAFTNSIFHDAGIFGAVCECAVLLTCLQIGYVIGVFSRPIHGKVQQRQACRAVPPARIAASRHRNFF